MYAKSLKAEPDLTWMLTPHPTLSLQTWTLNLMFSFEKLYLTWTDLRSGQSHVNLRSGHSTWRCPWLWVLPQSFNFGRIAVHLIKTSKNWELRFCVHVEKTIIILENRDAQLIKRLRPTFYDLVFTFPELTFHEWAFFNAVLLHTHAQLIPIQSSRYSILSNLSLFSVGVLFLLCVPSVQISPWAHLLVAEAIPMFWIG
jgi:hypothetical protein